MTGAAGGSFGVGGGFCWEVPGTEGVAAAAGIDAGSGAMREGPACAF